MKSVALDKYARMYRPTGCPVWHLDLNFPGQKRRRISLHSRNRDIAKAKARKLIDDAQAHSWGVLVPRDISFSDFLGKYLLYARPRNTERTIELNLNNLEHFRRFIVDQIGEERPFLLSNIHPSQIESYQAERRAKGISAWTIRRELGSLSIFFCDPRCNRLIPTGLRVSGSLYCCFQDNDPCTFLYEVQPSTPQHCNSIEYRVCGGAG